MSKQKIKSDLYAMSMAELQERGVFSLSVWNGFNIREWSKSIGGVGRSREGVGHEVLSLVQGVGRAIFSYP